VLEESFANLWQQFSRYRYGHGYDTAETRATLVLTLASNNTFELVNDTGWINSMREYFRTDKHPWSQEPLPGVYPEVLRALGEPVGGPPRRPDHPGVSGVFDLAGGEINLAQVRRELYWEQGRPEDFGSAEPHSVCYRLPYHLVKFVGVGGLPGTEEAGGEPFARTALHFLTSLCLRTTL